MGFGNGYNSNRGSKRYSNAALVHAFCADNGDSGQNARGSSHFSGGTLYSYATAIARIVSAPNGSRVLLIRDESFSVSTSQHMPSRRDYAGPCFIVPNIGNCEGRTKERYTHGDAFHALNVRVFVERWNNEAAAMRTIQPTRWADEMERQVSGYSYSYAGLDAPPADFAAAESNWRRLRVESLMSHRAACLAYCDAFALAYPVEFASESEARTLAETQASEALARFHRVLDDPKRALKREAQQRKASAKIEALAQTYIDATRHILATDAATLAAECVARGNASLYPPSIPYRVDGYTKAAVRAAGEKVRAAFDVPQRGDVQAKCDSVNFILQAKQREADANRFARWVAGESVTCPASYQTDKAGSVYMRRIQKGAHDVIQTSRGAEVLFSDAVRLFRFAKLIRARCFFPEMSEADRKTQAWHANGSQLRVTHFALSRVNVDGSCYVGCHFLAWERIAEAAQRCGVFDLEPADTTEQRGAA